MSSVTVSRLERGISPEDEEPEAKRRRLRKGTRSCWECKRRKVRCVFRSEGDAICGPCSRRGSNCVSQEFAEDEPQQGGTQLLDRLGRVEILLEHLVTEVRGKSGRDGVSTSEGTLSGARTPVNDSMPNLYQVLQEPLLVTRHQIFESIASTR
jgi:hypothetical protein